MKLSSGLLTIGYEKKYEFHKSGVENGENKGIIEEFIASICGTKIKVECAIIDEIAVDKQEDDIVEKAIRIFGKDIVEVEE
jgi:hypothetical protein